MKQNVRLKMLYIHFNISVPFVGSKFHHPSYVNEQFLLLFLM